MPAKDTFHEQVKTALIKDGWTITHDPAERSIAAQRGEEKVALEIKSFLSDSAVRELEIGLGQFVLYRMLMRTVEPDRTLLLAIPESAFKSLFEEPAGQRVIQEIGLKLVIFDPTRQEILRWLK